MASIPRLNIPDDQTAVQAGRNAGQYGLCEKAKKLNHRTARQGSVMTALRLVGLD